MAFIVKADQEEIMNLIEAHDREILIKELEKLTKQHIYQLDGREIQPEMTVWVIKKDYVKDRLASLKAQETKHQEEIE